MHCTCPDSNHYIQKDGVITLIGKPCEFCQNIIVQESNLGAKLDPQ